MARILVSAMPFAGHVNVLAPLAAELVRRGHEVVAYSGAKYAAAFTAGGTGLLPWTAPPDFDDSDLAATFPKVDNGSGVRSDRAKLTDVVIGTGAAQARDIVAANEREPFDLLVSDHHAFGTALAGEFSGVPWVSVATTPLAMSSRDLPPPGLPLPPATGAAGRARDAVLRTVFGVFTRLLVDPMINRMRAAVGLPPGRSGAGLEGMYSPYLVLAQGVPGLEFVRGDLPAHVRFVGRLSGQAPPVDARRLPSWWPELAAAAAAGRPIVHVTQGTLETGPSALLHPAVEALAGHRALVVCTTGGADPAVLGTLPGNVLAAPFVPHDLLLPMSGAMVTNGGFGGVLAALSAGVPLVVAPGSMDKPDVARRVGWSGAGIDLRTGRPSPAAVRAAVDRVLDDPAHARRAGELAGLLRAAGGTTAAATLVTDQLAVV